MANNITEQLQQAVNKGLSHKELIDKYDREYFGT